MRVAAMGRSYGVDRDGPADRAISDERRARENEVAEGALSCYNPVWLGWAMKASKAMLEAAQENHTVVDIRSKHVFRITFFIIASGILYGSVSGYTRFTNDMGGADFNVYYEAGETVLEGNAHDLYKIHTIRGPIWSYYYPPFFAVIMAPLAMLPLPAASFLWVLMNVFFTFHSLWLINKKLNLSEPKWLFPQLTLACSIVPISETMLLGQVHVLILYLMTLSWYFLGHEKDGKGAFFIAAATGIKLLPGIFALYFLLVRRFKAFAHFLLWFFLFVVVVPLPFLGPATTKDLLVEYYRIQIRPYLTMEGSPGATYDRLSKVKVLSDQDLGALIQRHFSEDHSFIEEYGSEGFRFLNLFQFKTTSARKFMFFLFGAFLVVTVCVYLRKHAPGGETPAAGMERDPVFSIFVLLSILISPRVKLCYLTVLMLPYGVLLSVLFAGSVKAALDRTTLRVMKAGVFLSLGCVVLFGIPLFRALSILYYGLVFLWLSLPAAYARWPQEEGASLRGSGV